MCELTLAVSWRHVASLTRFGFFRLPCRYSRRWWDSRLYRIWTNLKVQASLSSVVMLHLHCVFFFRLSVGNNALKFSNFVTPILKYLKNFCMLSFRRPNLLWNSPSSSFAQNILCIQYFRFTTFLPRKNVKRTWNYHMFFTSNHTDDSRMVAAEFDRESVELLN